VTESAKRRILVADDDHQILIVLREYLGCCGWDVDIARTASEAEAHLASHAYSAVITDLRFSGTWSSEGLDIIQSARRLCPSAAVVLMTGYGTPEAEVEARRLGADAYVPKPVPLWQLARLVQGWGGR
jgi:DNA-binding NtrC family response regulator